METVEEGVSNFREFQGDVRDFMTASNTRDKDIGKLLKVLAYIFGPVSLGSLILEALRVTKILP